MTPDDLRDWRKRRGLTQAGAAYQLGVSYATARAMEDGRRPIRRHTQLLCEALDREFDLLEVLKARPTP